METYEKIFWVNYDNTEKFIICNYQEHVYYTLTDEKHIELVSNLYTYRIHNADSFVKNTNGLKEVFTLKELGGG